jgi:hypothetical protein
MLRSIAMVAGLLVLLCGSVFAKTHVITFGKTMNVQWFVTPEKSQPIAVRPLYVDGKLREFTLGDAHDVTDGSFVVRRAYRINDYLPEDEKKVPNWKWQRGDWLLVNRRTGNVSAINLPDFDPYYSVVSWYRDYAAYCAIADEGAKVSALVVQLANKKPVLRKPVGPAKAGDQPDSECPAPKWQRDPTRVTFEPAEGQALTFDIRGHSADVADKPEKDDSAGTQ